VRAKRRKIQLELAFGATAKGETPRSALEGTEARTARAEPTRPAAELGPRMETIVERDNLRKALRQVQRNKGAPGIDGMTVEDLAAHLKDHWREIKAQLLEGTYRPQPVRRVEIPKATGGVRLLGIPTVLDRFIQQAALQVLQEDWDPTFSDSSYGFRPRRSAHQAVKRAQDHIRASFNVVVDIDLEKFLDAASYCSQVY
jgi:RNA-directed DNA polymerase